MLVRHSWVGLMLNGKRPAKVEPTPAILVARVPAPLPRPECVASAGRAPYADRANATGGTAALRERKRSHALSR